MLKILIGTQDVGLNGEGRIGETPLGMVHRGHPPVESEHLGVEINSSFL